MKTAELVAQFLRENSEKKVGDVIVELGNLVEDAQKAVDRDE